MGIRFILLIGIIVSTIFVDIVGYTWPVEILYSYVLGIYLAKMVMLIKIFA